MNTLSVWSRQLSAHRPSRSGDQSKQTMGWPLITREFKSSTNNNKERDGRRWMCVRERERNGAESSATAQIVTVNESSVNKSKTEGGGREFAM